jgi:hypothetical protein
MGFFRDLQALNKKGRELQDKMDVRATMAQAQAQMDALTASAASVPLDEATAISAVATVAGARETGMIINGLPAVEIDLMVLLPTGVPVQVTRPVNASPLVIPRLQPGSQIDVRLDPADPQNTLQLVL